MLDPRVSSVNPLQTAQVNATLDFKASPLDLWCKTDKKTIVQPKKEEKPPPKEPSSPLKRRGTLRSTIRKTKLFSPEEVKKIDKTNEDLKTNSVAKEQFLGALGACFSNIYKDKLNDVYIDKLRQRINRKEENDRIMQKELEEKENAFKNENKANVKQNLTGEIPPGVTFDGTTGKPMNMNQVNADKLPNLIGEHFDIKDDSNLQTVKAPRTTQNIKRKKE